MTLERIEKFREQIKEGKKLSRNELFDFALKANDEGKTYQLAIKIENSFYKDWHNRMQAMQPKVYLESLEDETTYITTTDNKAFKRGMGGYSIFATSIAEMLREVRDIQGHAYERIEHAPIEYGIVMGEI